MLTSAAAGGGAPGPPKPCGGGNREGAPSPACSCARSDQAGRLGTKEESPAATPTCIRHSSSYLCHGLASRHWLMAGKDTSKAFPFYDQGNLAIDFSRQRATINFWGNSWVRNPLTSLGSFSRFLACVRRVEIRKRTAKQWLIISQRHDFCTLRLALRALRNKSRPHRLARSRTPAFHAGNRGSNPLGDAMQK